MSMLKIVHITPTPLVGAPGRIAIAQRMKGHDAIAVAMSDYPKGGPLERMFLTHTLLINEFTRSYIENAIHRANIIHLHNFLPAEHITWLKELNQSADYVYQAHSPLREGPLYVNRGEDQSSFDFKLKLVVGQYQGRFYPSFLPVPNLVGATPSIRLRKKNEKLRVMYSPTHQQQGRWNSKYSEKLVETLSALSTIKKIELISPKQPVSPETLIEIRRNSHVSIDEITTGGFHMTSLEAMCVGNIAVNRADFFSKNTFASFCDGKIPPFLYADDSCITEFLLSLADDWERTANLQQASYDYFVTYCNPLRLVEVFDEAYQHIQ